MHTVPFVQFRHEQRDRDAVLIVRGEVDLAAAPDFRMHLDALIGASRSPGFVDLSGVSFLDCSGLGALVGAKRRAERRGVTLVLVAPSRPTRHLLDVTGMSSHFQIRS